MKLLNVKKVAIIALMLVMVASCEKFKNVGDGVKVIIDYNLIKTSINVRLIDASTGNLIGRDGSVSVKTTITGRDKDGVIDISGSQNENNVYMSQRGFVSLGLLPESMYKPSESNPISFNIVADYDGYLSTSQHVTIAAEGDNFVVIRMVKLDEPPSGVEVKREESATNSDATGRVSAPVVVDTPTGKASLSIPEGIILKDASGSPLQGSIDVLIAHFDNTDPDAMASFPGGLMTNVTLSDGSNQDGMFYSAGFVAIEITDASGRQAANFEQGTLGLVSQISPETFNPVTGNKVVSGDEIPLWSYDEANGFWKEESMLLIESSRSALEVQVELTHLSYFNFDWFYGGSYCNLGAPFVFTINPPLIGCFVMYGTMYRQMDHAFMQTVYMWVCNDTPVITYYAPSDVPVYIEWYNEPTSSLSVDPADNPTYIENLCGTNPININLINNPNTTNTTVTIHVEAYCPSDTSIVILPSGGAYIWPVADINNMRWVDMITGDAQITDVQIGATYGVGLYYKEVWYETEVVVTQSNYSYYDFELPADVCAEVYGL
jgi:hypothetical protein